LGGCPPLHGRDLAAPFRANQVRLIGAGQNQSLSGHSASAGATDPCVQRLERASFVRSAAESLLDIEIETHVVALVDRIDFDAETDTDTDTETDVGRQPASHRRREP
jgi:hypothetical protein